MCSTRACVRACVRGCKYIVICVPMCARAEVRAWLICKCLRMCGDYVCVCVSTCVRACVWADSCMATVARWMHSMPAGTIRRDIEPIRTRVRAHLANHFHAASSCQRDICCLLSCSAMYVASARFTAYARDFRPPHTHARLPFGRAVQPPAAATITVVAA